MKKHGMGIVQPVSQLQPLRIGGGESEKPQTWLLCSMTAKPRVRGAGVEVADRPEVQRYLSSVYKTYPNLCI
jgi:hypothetical protein